MRRAVLALILSLSSTPGDACVVSGAMDFRSILQADVVLQAQVLQAEAIQLPMKRGDGTEVLFHLHVNRLFEGPANITGQINVTAEFRDIEQAYSMVGKDYVFALVRDFGAMRAKPKPGSIVPWRATQEVMATLQGSCGFGTFIFDAGGPVRRAVEMLYDGQGSVEVEAAFLAEYLQMTGSGLY